MSTDTPRPERVTLTDALLAGLHEAGWFARAGLDPDHLGGIFHDAAYIAGEWAAAREQALREEIADDLLAMGDFAWGGDASWLTTGRKVAALGADAVRGETR